MSTDFQPLDYNVNDVGKIMKASKKRHMWIFRYKSKRFTLCVFESLKSGKFKIELNKKKIYETIGGKRSISKKVHDSRLGTLTIELMKITNNKYRLTVNKNTFESKNKAENLFVYETFEQKQKKIQQEAANKKNEDFFGINSKSKGSKGLKGSDLFGDFKGKSNKGNKMKINFGMKNQKKKDLFTFDKGVFGKKGKFGNNDFFGAKKSKNKNIKKQDPFGEGSDLFSSKKNKKITSDFDGFDIFGGSKKGGQNSVAKKKTGFDDFGFGNKKPAKTKKKDGWDDFDFFGKSKPNPKNNKNKILDNSSGPKKSRLAKNEIFGNQPKVEDSDLLNFDIDVPTPSQPVQPPKPVQSGGFGDLDWDMPVKTKKPVAKVKIFLKI